MISVALDVSAVPARPAGAGRYIVELARRVAADANLDVTLVSRRDDGERFRGLAPRARVLAIAPRYRPTRVAWERMLLGVSVVGASRDRRPAVLHAPHYSMPLVTRMPVVVTIHDLTLLEHPEWHERSKVAILGRAVRYSASHASALICVSAATRDRLVELLRPECPVHVVPHGVDSEAFAADEPVAGTDARVLAELGVRQPYVLHVGTLEPRKDVPTLLRAFDLVAEERTDLSLVLAGVPGWGTREVAATLSELRHRDRVRRLGYVDGAFLPSLVRRAGVVAYASREEGFGLPALEALACGAPLVTTAGTVMEDVAGGAAQLVGAGDPPALAGALGAALEGGAEVDARRARGIELAALQSWDRSAAAHARVYEETAGAAGGERIGGGGRSRRRRPPSGSGSRTRHERGQATE